MRIHELTKPILFLFSLCVFSCQTLAMPVNRTDTKGEEILEQRIRLNLIELEAMKKRYYTYMDMLRPDIWLLDLSIAFNADDPRFKRALIIQNAEVEYRKKFENAQASKVAKELKTIFSSLESLSNSNKFLMQKPMDELIQRIKRKESETVILQEQLCALRENLRNQCSFSQFVEAKKNDFALEGL